MTHSVDDKAAEIVDTAYAFGMYVAKDQLARAGRNVVELSHEDLTLLQVGILAGITARTTDLEGYLEGVERHERLHQGDEVA